MTISNVSEMPFPVVDVSDWEPIDLETSGGNEGHWRRDPRGDDWYFKPRTEHGDRVEGEDWAEKISAGYADLLGVPAAQVELARLAGRRGSISRSVRPHEHELQHGELLIGAVVDGFVRHAKDRLGHNIATIRRVLDPFQAPPGLPETWSAFDAFAGYLVLDALIANMDRHEENWAVLRPLDGNVYLCPSYDHGSALAFGLTDAKRRHHLDHGTMSTFCSRAVAKKFERATDGRLTLVEAARSALSLASDAAQNHWRAQVIGMDVDRCAIVVNRVPNLSDVTRTFVHELTRINVERLCHEL